MPMTPFLTYFPDVAAKETRTVTFRGRRTIPDGEYGLIELYCDELDCDCRRVIIDVMSAPPHTRIWATINYGWETVEFYTSWSHDPEIGKQAQGAILEPFGPQSRYSHEFIKIVKAIAFQDDEYVRRLQRHYAMFKDAIAAEHEARHNKQRRKQEPSRRNRSGARAAQKP
jgi:hypothetical protein